MKEVNAADQPDNPNILHWIITTSKHFHSVEVTKAVAKGYYKKKLQ
jgi:hypothetical protein